MGFFEKRKKDLKIPGAEVLKIIREEFPRLFAVFLAFFFMALAGSISVGKLEEERIVANAESVLDTAEEVIYADIREAEVAVLSAALSLQNHLKNGYDREEIQASLGEFVDWLLLPSVGISGFLNVYCFINGDFISGKEIALPDDYRADDRPWYRAALANTDKIGFTSPYYDADTGKIILSISKALKNAEGKIFGVIAADTDINNISLYVTSLQFSRSGYGVLIDQDLTFIAHPDERFIGKKLAEASPKHAELADNFTNNVGKYTALKLYNAQGAPFITFFRKLKYGWYVGIETPSGVYYQNTYLIIFILSSLGFIFMLVLNYLLIQMSKAEKKADEENKSKSSFLARMSHEIRTPMNAILSLAEILLRKNLTKDIRSQVLIIKQSGAVLLALVNDILDFSKFEAGRLQLESKKYEFAPLIEEVVTLIRMRLEGKPIDFFISVDGNIPAVLEGDEIRIRQVLINLLNNAVKYTKSGSISLAVTMKKFDDSHIRLFFEVSDTGIGIKAKDIKMLFTEFTRVDMERNQGIEGTGLGLAIANTICKAMDGEIAVSSVYEEGSVFTASVVQRFENDKKAAAVPSAELKKAMVFEDRPMHLKFLKAAFENLGIAASYKMAKEEFIQDLTQCAYDFAFIPSKYAKECIPPIWGKQSGADQLIIMAEMQDAMAFDDTGNISLPVYSIPLADVLNGASKNNEQNVCENDSPGFIASSAYVLIVDDIATNLMVAEELLKFYELRVDTCASGEEALRLVREKRYDLIFMDYMMPGMNGLEASRKIRLMGDEDLYYHKVPIIALTADVFSNHREMFIQNGLNDFLSKPIEPDKLCAVLRKWLPDDKIESANQRIKRDDNLVLGKIDVKTGVKNTGGSLASYLKVLNLFQSDAGERIHTIKQSAASGNIELYTTMVHGLKSASRSIGASEFGDFAEEMEAAGRNNDLSTIRRRTGELINHLASLLKDIEEFLQKNASDAAESAPSLSKDQLAALRRSLVSMDITNLDRLLAEYSASSLNADAKQFLEELEEDVLLFEYDRAVGKIDLRAEK